MSGRAAAKVMRASKRGSGLRSTAWPNPGMTWPDRSVDHRNERTSSLVGDDPIFCFIRSVKRRTSWAARLFCGGLIVR